MTLRHNNNAFVPYSDVMTLMVSSLVLILSLVVILVIKQVSATANLDMHPKAEYLVTLNWDDNRNVDLDLWLQDPNGNVVYYRNREVANISLDRDSRGFTSNKTMLPDGTSVISGNREVITVRAVIPGDYLAAVDYFGGLDVQSGIAYVPSDPAAEIDWNVRVEKVNPTLVMVSGKNGKLHHVKDAVNALSFHVNPDGSVTTLPTSPIDLISSHVERH